MKYESIEEIYLNYRKMSKEQLKLTYHVSDQTIKRELKKHGYNTNLNIINKNLSEDEVIYIYKSLIDNERINFPNGFCSNENSYKYFKIIIKYLIEEILEWNRIDITQNYNTSFLNKYKLIALYSALKKSFHEIINDIYPQYDIKKWEFRQSSCGNDFWNKENIEEASKWFKSKLKSERNIYNINQAKLYGLSKLLDEYNLKGLINSVNKSCIGYFEEIYNEKIDYNIINENNFTFTTNISDIECNNEDIVYEIKESYYELDNQGKTLINEIIRFCENENKFPKEKDLTNKNGYISRTQFYKYFKTNNIRDIYNYIIPIQTVESKNIKVKIKNKKIESIVCNKCKTEKPFTKEYFSKSKYNKFGLSYTCKNCLAKLRVKQEYSKKGIIYDEIEDIPIEKWYDELLDENIRYMPKFCYEPESIKIIVRYIYLNKLKCISKEDIQNNYNKKIHKKYKIADLVYKIGNHLKSLQYIFPEFEFIEADFETYNNEDINQIISSYVEVSNLDVKLILENKFNLKDDKTKESRQLINLIAARFTNNKNEYNGINGAFLWYFNYNNILHFDTNRKINIEDFKTQNSNYYLNKENRLKRIRYYCENQCEESILFVLDSTEDLKKWISKYFTSNKMSEWNIPYSRYYKSLYEVLIDAYPTIYEKKILFKWEWHQWNRYDKKFLIDALRDLIQYRLNDFIKDYKKDIPKYINRSFMDLYFPKFNKHIDRERFKDYYEWCCLCFPQYKDIWKRKDFGQIVSKDGTIFDSYNERNVYDYLKSLNIFSNIQYIGREKGKSKYKFKNSIDNKVMTFYPDFVIEKLNIDNKNFNLDKPIIVEYYGMYDVNSKYYVIKNYVEKTDIKEQYYKKNNDIYYVGIFPNDIKDNFKILKDKLNNIKKIIGIYNDMI